MPKSKHRRTKKMRGGLFGFGEGDSSGSGESSGVGSFFSGLTNKAKSATGSASSWFSSAPAEEAPAEAQSQPGAPASYGGRRHRRTIRGGYHSSTGNSNLANNASTYGGSRKRRHKHPKSCHCKICHHHKHSKSCHDKHPKSCHCKVCNHKR